jgi:hypothetical protein
MQHDLDLFLRDPEGQQRANEYAHAVDAVHVQNLTEVAADDAALWSDFFHRAAIVDLFSPVALLSARRTKTGNNGVVNLSTESDQAQCEETH